MIRRYLPLMAMAALSLMMVVVLAAKFDSSAPTRHDPLIGRKLPEFALPLLDAPGTLASLELTGQVFVLNSFASWCASCIMEHKTLQAIEDVPVYGIAWRDKPGDTRSWLEKRGNPYDKVGVDADGKGVIALGLTGVPETYVVDRNGVVADVLRGPLTPELRETWLNPLLKELGAGDER